ncbi:MAG: PRD domain-containing protein [Lachnospiraceae bacterium]
MIIEKIYNNNIAAVLSEDGTEIIASGRGICYGKQAGDNIEESKIEKRFVLQDARVISRLDELLARIPDIYLTIAEEIVQMIRAESELELSENIYITLMDHISLSLEREKKGVIYENPLLMDIKQIYKREYLLAKKARKIIERHIDIRISEHEVGSIALHFVNASMNQQFSITMRAPKLIQTILEIIRVHFRVELDDSSFHYERFLRHLQFFVKRVLDDRESQESDTFLYRLCQERYPDVLSCVRKITLFIEMNYEKKVSRAEEGFIAYHIINVVREVRPELFDSEQDSIV